MMEITEDFENLLSSSTFFDSCSTFSEFAPEEAVAVPPIYINDRALATVSSPEISYSLSTADFKITGISCAARLRHR